MRRHADRTLVSAYHVTWNVASPWAHAEAPFKQQPAHSRTTPHRSSPVLTKGGFPIISGHVTSFDTIEKVTLAKYGLAPLLAGYIIRARRRVRSLGQG